MNTNIIRNIIRELHEGAEFVSANDIMELTPLAEANDGFLMLCRVIATPAGESLGSYPSRNAVISCGYDGVERVGDFVVDADVSASGEYAYLVEGSTEVSAKFSFSYLQDAVEATHLWARSCFNGQCDTYVMIGMREGKNKVVYEYEQPFQRDGEEEQEDEAPKGTFPDWNAPEDVEKQSLHGFIAAILYETDQGAMVSEIRIHRDDNGLSREASVEDIGDDDDYHARYLLSPSWHRTDMFQELLTGNRARRIEFSYDSVVDAIIAAYKWVMMSGGGAKPMVATAILVNGEKVTCVTYTNEGASHA